MQEEAYEHDCTVRRSNSAESLQQKFRRGLTPLGKTLYIIAYRQLVGSHVTADLHRTEHFRTHRENRRQILRQQLPTQSGTAGGRASGGNHDCLLDDLAPVPLNKSVAWWV